MTAKELANVLGNEFIAVGFASNKNIGYSGKASAMKWFGADNKVVEVIPAKSDSKATIIYVEG